MAENDNEIESYICTSGFCGDGPIESNNVEQLSFCRSHGHELLETFKSKINSVTKQKIKNFSKNKKFESIPKASIGPYFVESVLIDKKPKFLCRDKDSSTITVKESLEFEGIKYLPLERYECGYFPYAFTSSEVLSLIESPLDKEELLDQIKEQIDHFIVTRGLDKHLILGDIFLTYCQEWIQTLHFPFFVGETESGKSSVLYLGKYLNYRCLYGEDISHANIYNFLGTGEEGTGTIEEDEAQEILKDKEKIRTYKGSYAKGSIKPKIVILQNRKFQTYYKTFCPKWFAGERIPQDKGFLERLAIVNMMEGKPKGNIKRITEQEQQTLFELRNKLLVWKLQNIGVVFERFESHLEGRDQELWEDFLSVVQETKYFEKCNNVVKFYTEQRRAVIKNSLEAKLCKLILEKIDQNFKLNFLEFWDYLTSENNVLPGTLDPKTQRTFYLTDFYNNLTHQSLSKIIEYKFQGIKRQIKIRENNGIQRQITYYVFKKDVLETLIKKYDVEVNLDNPIFVSQVGELGQQTPKTSETSNQVDQVNQDNNENDNWETPKALFQDLCRKYKLTPQIDVACNTRNCKCDEGYYFDQNCDGLTLDWEKSVWCNPPHSQTEKWVRKAFSEWKARRISIMMIIPANTISSAYWQECIEDKAEYHTIPGRIRFQKDGIPSPYPSRNAYFCVIWRGNQQV